MAHRAESTSEKCPLINKRVQPVLLYIPHPLDLPKNIPYTMDVELFDLIATATAGHVRFKEEVLKESSTHSDFYGLGTSREEVLEWAQTQHAHFADPAFSITVTTTLIRTPVFLDLEKEGFYNNSVQVYRLPRGAFYPEQPEDLAEHGKKQFRPIKESDQKFLIWENGAQTPAYHEVEEIIQLALANDEAGPYRRRAT